MISAEYIVRYYLPALIKEYGKEPDQVANRPRLFNIESGGSLTIDDDMISVIISAGDDVQVTSQDGQYAPGFGREECQIVHSHRMTATNHGSQTATLSLIQFSIS